MLAGEIVAGPYVRAACQRHLTDLVEGPKRGLRFEVDKAERAIGFFRDVLRLNGGEHEGRPFVLEPFQSFIVGSAFGWLRADGLRRFRTLYFEGAKGNGKSPLAAGIGLYCLMADEEPRAEVYSAASKKDQAMILFRDAVAMVNQSPALHARLIQTGGNNVYQLGYPKTGSFFKAIASDNSQSGPRPHCSLIDEIHEHTDATTVNMLVAGQKGRRQPLTCEFTNSGFDRTTICYQHHEYSIRVVQGLEQDDEWFAYVCALDEADEPFEDESCWIKANPNLGVSVTLDYLRKQVREALGMPANASTVRRLNFCQWVGAENPWIDGPLWLACEQEFAWLEEFAGAPEVVGALDLSGTLDLTALGLAASIEELIKARVEFWTPKDTLAARVRTDKVPYDSWVDRGFITATPGRAVNYAWVAERLAQLQVLLPNLRRVCFDPYRIKYLEVELANANVEIELVPHPQGYYKPKDKEATEDEAQPAKPNLWMPRSIELMEKAIVDGRFQVLKNPCLTHCSASAVLEADQKNNRIFAKRKSRGRIDGIVALAMAVGLLHEGERPAALPPSIRWL